MRWLRRWRERDDRHLFKSAAAAPLPDIDPIEELDRLVRRSSSARRRGRRSFRAPVTPEPDSGLSTEPLASARHGWAMQYRIQFLDARADVIRELTADARSAAHALSLVVDIDWPPGAVTIRVLDLDGREVHSAIKEDG